MFNLKLAEYLVLYNSKILHKSFKLQKSVEYIISTVRRKIYRKDTNICQ
ncbi:hypothetical protein ECEC1846_4163 [Escherichia coli EC1846]|uniref:Uncharacterized protein n=1 Tax=Escherichia coli 3.4880 TaxID=1051347 RepID=A0AAV3I1Q4_ECOLX|nr:hypothetical protein SS17_3999 [Escherichia coli O157:H7 str. SS17]AOM48519.1 hypothetical protein FORC28_5543 [Escherichia coli]EFZ61625.1 hypothetical protein ECOK1180_4719 [Escherichia coli OK1180]EHU56878.1 hypothetical protein ECDEC3A_3879 [Escherichia coli DEC3A]EHU72481.1 hypothetical protein ECDEC3D_4040 [Escherichia coli DEC3D]EHU74823.1 hypothetical protein ECDEC3E_4277 [Escherichia coli DEC3E]EHU89117.1 hypothetical protein ECDEC4A_3832 [Escherichia coli DEC4A]EHV03471.1 hypoth